MNATSEGWLDASLPSPLVCAISIASPSSPSSIGTSSTMALSTLIYTSSSMPRVRTYIGLISPSRVCRAMPVPEHAPVTNRASGCRCIATSGRSAAAIGPSCCFLTCHPMLVSRWWFSCHRLLTCLPRRWSLAVAPTRALWLRCPFRCSVTARGHLRCPYSRTSPATPTSPLSTWVANFHTWYLPRCRVLPRLPRAPLLHFHR
jgi:hypothetical protein